MYGKVMNIFSNDEKRNIRLYIMGIMFYKIGIELFYGSAVLLAQDKFIAKNASSALTSLGALLALNQAMQCVGSILIAPLMARFPIKTVLSIAIWTFSVIVAIGVVLEASTGGKLPSNSKDSSYHGYWDVVIVYPLYASAGICHGMIELIRRVIPQAIVGGNVSKLKKMDSLVHICYEVAGTAGALFSAFLIMKMGNAYAPCITPIVYIISGLIWYSINITSDFIDSDEIPSSPTKTTLLGQIVEGFVDFASSVYQGAKIVLTNRRFSWLILGYSLPLVLHRYLESQLSPIFAKKILDRSYYAQILVGGSNLGELGGAFFVLVFTELVKTPLPWVRLDALTLAITWILPYSYPTNPDTYIWLVAFVFVFVSGGWAAGDVSLAAYIQSSLSKMEIKNRKISPLAAVMAFLYSIYIAIYAIVSPTLGKLFDHYQNEPRTALFWVAGVGYSCCGVLIFLSTFIPKGSFALNPELDEKDRVEDDKVKRHSHLDVESATDEIKKPPKAL